MFGAAVAATSAYEPLPQDTGAAGTYQKLLKLRTIASVMHTTAHPDDEHGGLLAWLSRGMGARVSLMTLNRGESGDNALGPAAVRRAWPDSDRGAARSRIATTAWTRSISPTSSTTASRSGSTRRSRSGDARTCCAMSFASSGRSGRWCWCRAFRGTNVTGMATIRPPDSITLEAFRAAGDPKQFPEQIAEGLRPWQPRKVYIGGVREDEPWNVRVDPGQYSPWLGMSYADFARVGLSYQRSQNSGRLSLAPGPQYGYYKRVDAPVGDRSRAAMAERVCRRARERVLRWHQHVAYRSVQRDTAPGACRRGRAACAPSPRRSTKRLQRFTMDDPSAVGAGARRAA